MSKPNDKHTPGPWQVDGNVVFNPCAPYTGSSGKMIASVAGWGNANWEIQTANAQLIATAPELLEALKHIINEADRLQSDAPIWDDARAAIAKASG